jgi:hypothetical protein
MYGIFERNAATLAKRRAYADKSFATLDEAKDFFGPGATFEIDPDHDAADVFTDTGSVYAVEPI